VACCCQKKIEKKSWWKHLKKEFQMERMTFDTQRQRCHRSVLFVDLMLMLMLVAVVTLSSSSTVEGGTIYVTNSTGTSGTTCALQAYW